MKKNIILLILTLIFIPLCSCYEIRCTYQNIKFNLKDNNHILVDRDSSDSIYPRLKILKNIAKDLYNYNKQLKKNYGSDEMVCDFCVWKNNASCFEIWDLYENKNKNYYINPNYHFKNFHTYFVKGIVAFYTKKIVALINGKILIYDVYNIETQENQIEEIIKQLKLKLPKEYLTDDLIQRIRDVEVDTTFE